MKTAFALLAPALLIAHSAAAQPMRAAPYKALGTEPFWSLTIDARSIRFEDAERRRLVVPAPVPRPSFNGMRYVTPRIIVDVTRSRCSDGMSERVYPDSVTVTIGRRTLKGCGGNPIVAPAPVSVIEGRWRIDQVDGRRPMAQREAFVSFTGNRIGGSTGCNSFGGTFRFERGILSIDAPLISTQMGCPGPAMAQERAVLGALGERLSVSQTQTGKLILSSRSGPRLRLKR